MQYILVAGLCNPGAEYHNTRHNIGAMFLDEIRNEHAPNTPWRSKFKGEYLHFDNHGKRVILLKPTTYMNLSGFAIQNYSHFFKITPSNILVLHDDIDLPLYKIKTKIGGGTGGHNGLASIDSALGTKEYARLRIGVGRPQHKDEVANYVLSTFRQEELVQFALLSHKFACTLTTLFTEGFLPFSHKLNMNLNVF